MTNLTSKQRVKMSLAHQEPDRVPLCEIWVNNNVISAVLGQPARVGIGSGSPHYEAIRATMRGHEPWRELIRQGIEQHLLFCEKIGIDVAMLRIHHYIVGVHSKAYLGPNGLYDDLSVEEVDDKVFVISHPEGFWSKLAYSESMGTLIEVDDGISHGGLPELKRYVDYLESRAIELTAPFLDILDGIRYAVASEAGRRLFVLGTADVCYPMNLHYLPIFLEAMAMEPELVDRYMTVTTEGVLSFLRPQLELGVDGIIGSTDMAFKTGLMFSVNHFKRFIAPHLKRIVDECHRFGVPYIKHLDGNVNKIVPILVDDIGVDALHALEPTAQMDIVALKHAYGHKISLWGNLDCGHLLTEGTTEEIEAEVKRIIRDVSPGGGHGFSSSNAIHTGVPLENFYALVNAVEKYGRYPISI